MGMLKNKIDLFPGGMLLHVLKKLVHRQFFYYTFHPVLNNAFSSLTLRRK
jgi:hypothetical protein